MFPPPHSLGAQILLLIMNAPHVGTFLIGFGIGAIVAGPFSETFGRNMVYIVTTVMFMIFIMASGLAPNIEAQISFRFLAGFFGAAPLTCAGGSVSDMWDSLERSHGFPLYAIPAFSGPVLGPVIGSYIGDGRIGSWRWTEWITLIMAGWLLCVIVLFQKETYPPLLLKWKAQHLRRITGDDRFRAELEITKATLWTRLKISLERPFLLMLEPIVMLMALYLTVIYIVLFTFLSGLTYIFTEVYEISRGLTSVIFVGMLVGILAAAPLVPFTYIKTKQDMERHKSENGSHVNPEVRLWFAMLGAPAIPISLFWMGWTAYVSFPPPNFRRTKAHQVIAVGQHMVSHNRVSPLWLRPDMYLHECLYVHHRLIRDLCCFCTHLCDYHTIPGRGRYDRCWYTIL